VDQRTTTLESPKIHVTTIYVTSGIASDGTVSARDADMTRNTDDPRGGVTDADRATIEGRLLRKIEHGWDAAGVRFGWWIDGRTEWLGVSLTEIRETLAERYRE